MERREHDGANLVAMWVRPTKPAGYEAAVSWIGRTGALLDPSPTTLGPIDYPWRPLALSVGANGNLLATYAAYDDSPDFQTQRLRTRLLTGSPLGSDAAVPDGGAPAVDASGVLQEAGARDDAPVADGALDDALKAQSDAAPAYLDAAGEDGHNAGNTASAGTCACRLGGHSGPPALAILLVLVALPRRRRR